MKLLAPSILAGNHANLVNALELAEGMEENGFILISWMDILCLILVLALKQSPIYVRSQRCFLTFI